ncbi:hypothetical protein K1719_019095 [Acacia pycnantha]|nr:hypothetical protein K1719_019095 [Acacia pycnantha]
MTSVSAAVPLLNVGPHYETWNAGVLGPFTLSGLNEGRRDLSWQKWSYKIGLKGESLSLHSRSGSSSVEWMQGYLVSQKQPLTWYKFPKGIVSGFKQRKGFSRSSSPPKQSKKEVLNPKKKDLSREKLPRNGPYYPSALFFAHNTELGPPYRVLVDTNFIHFSIENKALLASQIV